MDGATRDEIYRLHAEICRALADPNRLLLLEELRAGERSVGQLAFSLGLAQAKTSQHLAVLREKGLVITRRQATTVFYSLSDPTILQAIDLLRGVLARHLERQANTHEMLLDELQAVGQALS
jgi:ArsR family transcriptional regulator